jgi:uncharacterized protein
MVAELLPSFAPVPSSVAAVARLLPASERPRLAWFPSAFRTAFVAPLVHAPAGAFHAQVDELLVGAVRVVLQLTANLHVVSASLGPQAMTRALEQEELRQAWHDLVPRLLEPVDMAASDDLREAYEWLRAITSAISITLRGADLQSDGDALAHELETINDEEIRRALVGEARPFFRGLLLTVGALDVLEGGQVPPAVAEWCRLALEELHVTASALRAMGIPMPAEIQIPGHDAAAWRARRAAQRARRPSPLLDLAPRAGIHAPGAIERIVEVLHPEQIWLFGSRARGTAGPESDWDLLVVVADSAETPLDDESWRALRDVRRQQIEIVPIHRAEFEADRQEFGTLAHVATTTGRLVYGR